MMSPRIWFKACQRCHGDLVRDVDSYGSYIACLQCGNYLTGSEEARVTQFIPGPGVRHAPAVLMAKAAA